jgi:3-methyladenine DNA glycosylase/8-oxoguanine DNA glycosylase
MFDLDADVPAFAAHVAADEVLGPLVASHPSGIRLPQLLDPFEAMVRAVLGQQVSVQAASTMTDRVTRLAGEAAPVLEDTDGAVALPLAFPAPRALLESGEASLRGIGLTGAKTKSLLGLARAVCEGTLDLRAVREMPAADAQAALVALPGIGPWTASYVRMRSLGDRDAFPAADLGVIKAMAARGVARGDIEAAAERWRPWRAYATLHLWQSLAAKN